MEIHVQSHAGGCELQLAGRLDANWADHVAKAMESAIRAGHHHVDLDFARVSYISSAGIRVLLKYARQLKAARGLLRVVNPIDHVLSVLRLTGLAGILLTPEAQSSGPVSEPAAREDVGQAAVRRWQINEVEFEAYETSSAGPLKGEVLGRPEALAGGQLSAAQCQVLRCTPDVLAVGLGAFGVRDEEAESRFGEALAVAGVAVTLPTDGSSLPDYQVAEGDLVPELRMLYGLAARGEFSRLIRFEASRSQRGVLGLGELVEAALDASPPAAGFAILAESASVVGAMLKRSPAIAAGQSIMAFPAVRDWLTFTTERTDERNLVLIAGIAERTPQPEAAACLRPVGPGTDAHGHFHAAVFPYRPLPKGRLDLREAVVSVIGTESAQLVMHLLADQREFEGVGQTDLTRGACWVGALKLSAQRRQPDTSL